MYKLMVLLIAFALVSQGCAVGVIAAGLGAYKMGKAKQMEAYKDYMLEMEKINLLRIQQGVPEQEIKPFKDWMKK